MKRLLELIGLDWLPILIGRKPFVDAPLPFPSLSEVQQAVSILETDKLDDTFNYCDGILRREESRLDKIESKAFTLIGVTGIAAAFITGFASLLLDRAKFPASPLLVLAAIFYVVVIFSLIFTVFLALKVVAIGAYRLSYPGIAELTKLPGQALIDAKRNRIVSLYYSITTNTSVINSKGTFLGAAQLWFRNSMLLLFALTFTLATYVVWDAFNMNAAYQPANMPATTYTPTATPPPTMVPLTSTVGPTPSSKAP